MADKNNKIDPSRELDPSREWDDIQSSIPSGFNPLGNERVELDDLSSTWDDAPSSTPDSSSVFDLGSDDTPRFDLGSSDVPFELDDKSSIVPDKSDNWDLLSDSSSEDIPSVFADSGISDVVEVIPDNKAEFPLYRVTTKKLKTSKDGRQEQIEVTSVTKLGWDGQELVLVTYTPNADDTMERAVDPIDYCRRTHEIKRSHEYGRGDILEVSESYGFLYGTLHVNYSYTNNTCEGVQGEKRLLWEPVSHEVNGVSVEPKWKKTLLASREELGTILDNLKKDFHVPETQTSQKRKLVAVQPKTPFQKLKELFTKNR